MRYTDNHIPGFAVKEGQDQNVSFLAYDKAKVWPPIFHRLKTTVSFEVTPFNESSLSRISILAFSFV